MLFRSVCERCNFRSGYLPGFSRQIDPLLRLISSRCSFGHQRTNPRRLVSGHQPTKSVIPESLLIYHAGTGRIAFVGCMKVTTIFLFAANLLVIAPKVFKNAENPLWAAPIVAAGAIPMLCVTWLYGPFVAFVHIRLPSYARRSRALLLSSADKITASTELDLTTIKRFGRTRVTRVPFGELWPTKARVGIQNIVRVRDAPLKHGRKWWQGNGQDLFFVGNSRKKSVETIVWEKVWDQIKSKKPHVKSAA